MVEETQDRTQRRPVSDGHRLAGARPTLRTIAELTGLAVTTVSRALKDGPELSARTRERVRDVADRIGYRPDRAGVRLRTGRTYVIALVFDHNDTIAEFARRIMIGVSTVLHGTSYHLVVLPQMRDADPMDPVRYVLDSRAADGLILTHTRPRDARVRLLTEAGFPFVTHGRTEQARPHPYHDYDTVSFAEAAAKRLLDKGRHRLALIRPPREFTYCRHMVEGFLGPIGAAGAESILVPGVDLDSDPSDLRAAARRLAAARRPPDGILCANETRSIAMMAGFQDGGLRIGRDIDVIAKQTSDLLDHMTPAIDSFVEDLTLAGAELARLLLRRIAGASMAELQSLGAPEFRRRT